MYNNLHVFYLLRNLFKKFIVAHEHKINIKQVPIFFKCDASHDS